MKKNLLPFPHSSPRPSATTAVFSPSYARSTASSVMRAEQVAAELAQREREAILRLEADAIVAAELKKEEEAAKRQFNGWLAVAVEDDIEERDDTVEVDKDKAHFEKKNEREYYQQSDNQTQPSQTHVLDDTTTRKLLSRDVDSRPELNDIHLNEKNEVETLRHSLQQALIRADNAEAAQFKAELGERISLRKAAAHASAAAALRKVVAAIENANIRQTKKLLARLETAGHQLSRNRTEIETLKEQLQKSAEYNNNYKEKEKEQSLMMKKQPIINHFTSAE
jgi:hypothetical protein